MRSNVPVGKIKNSKMYRNVPVVKNDNFKMHSNMPVGKLKISKIRSNVPVEKIDYFNMRSNVPVGKIEKFKNAQHCSRWINRDVLIARQYTRQSENLINAKCKAIRPSEK